MGRTIHLKVTDEDERTHHFEIVEGRGEYIVYRVQYESGLMALFSGPYRTEIARAKSYDRAIEYMRSFVGRKIRRIEER